MRSTPEDYQSQLSDLLPPGPAWSREPDSILLQFLRGLAEELSRVHNRALDVIEEVDPRTTLEMLPDWERVFGLPEPCVDPPTTLAGRRAALHEKMIRQGGQSRAFYIALAAGHGFPITITEFHPFVAGSEAGEPALGEEWWFTWQVNAPETTITSVFQVGYSTVGDPLRSWGNVLLECLLTRLKPAHTVVLFSYG